MKEIKAILQPFMLSKVAWALQQVPDFPGMTVSRVQGFGRGKAKGAPDAIMEDLIDYVPRVRIEIVVKDDMVEKVVRTIAQNAHTGNKGDGKVFVCNVEHIIRVRTGETNENAL